MNIHYLGKIAGGQDGAIWHGYLFRFDAKGICSVYNLNDTSTSNTFPEISCFTLDRSEMIVPHSNSVMFGNEYYCEEDEFPLLYSNIYNNYASANDQLKGVTCVYRLQRSGSDFTTTLVQLIEIGFTEDPLWRSQNVADIRPFGNFAIDRKNSVYYTFTMCDEDQTSRYFSFVLPRLHDGVYDEKFGVNHVILNKQDIIDHFVCEYHRFIQGASYHNGFIYSLEGFTNSADKPPAFRIIDMHNQTQKEMYLFSDYGMNVEPEMIDFENDICYYSDSHGNLYKIVF